MSGEYIVARFTAPAAQVDASDGIGSTPTRTLVAADYYIDELCDAFETALNATGIATYTVSISATTGLVTIDCSHTPWSITWTSTTLRDMLGFAGDISGVSVAQTGTKQAKGLWYPHCSLAIDTDPLQAPRADDSRAVVSPTGVTYAVVGVSSYRHRNLRFSHVPQAYAWAASASVVNSDYETFYLDALAGLGHSWFSPRSVCILGWSNAGTVVSLGSGASIIHWTFPQPQSLDELAQAVQNYTGYVTVMLGDARSAG